MKIIFEIDLNIDYVKYKTINFNYFRSIYKIFDILSNLRLITFGKLNRFGF